MPPRRRSAPAAPPEIEHRGVRRLVRASRSEPGSRVASMFFEKYPAFYETSQTAAVKDRLNLRYEAIFAENRDIFAGAKVLDIASHDGRWSFAALDTGAESVIGIEARPELVEHATSTLAGYGYGDDRASFVQGDVHEVLAKNHFDVDVVLCLGFLYHTLRYNELMHGIRRCEPEYVLVDTQAQDMVGSAPVVYTTVEGDWQGNAVTDDFSHGSVVLTGRPNLRAVGMMMRAYGFGIERLSDWPGLIRDNPQMVGVGDYERLRRMTIRCRDQHDEDGSALEQPTE